MPMSPVPDLQQDVGRVYKLISDKNELEKENHVLRTALQQLKEKFVSQPDEYAQAQLSSDLDAAVEQLVIAEEARQSMECKAGQYEKRLEDVVTCRDRMMHQLNQTLDELRDQNTQLQAFMSQLRGDRDAALQKVKDLQETVKAQQQQLFDLKANEARTINESLSDMEVLCSQMEHQVSTQVKLKEEKQEECTRLSLHLEELQAAHTDAKTDIVALTERAIEESQLRSQVEAQRRNLESDLLKQKTALKEKDIERSLLAEEVEVLRVECSLLKRSLQIEQQSPTNAARPRNIDAQLRYLEHVRQAQQLKRRASLSRDTPGVSEESLSKLLCDTSFQPAHHIPPSSVTDAMDPLHPHHSTHAQAVPSTHFDTNSLASETQPQHSHQSDPIEPDTDRNAFAPPTSDAKAADTQIQNVRTTCQDEPASEVLSASDETRQGRISEEMDSPLEPARQHRYPDKTLDAKNGVTGSTDIADTSASVILRQPPLDTNDPCDTKELRLLHALVQKTEMKADNEGVSIRGWPHSSVLGHRSLFNEQAKPVSPSQARNARSSVAGPAHSHNNGIHKPSLGHAQDQSQTAYNSEPPQQAPAPLSHTRPARAASDQPLSSQHRPSKVSLSSAGHPPAREHTPVPASLPPWRTENGSPGLTEAQVAGQQSNTGDDSLGEMTRLEHEMQRIAMKWQVEAELLDVNPGRSSIPAPNNGIGQLPRFSSLAKSPTRPPVPRHTLLTSPSVSASSLNSGTPTLTYLKNKYMS